MIRYALYDYQPVRRWKHLSFEEQDTARRILDFKNGRNYASRWAAEEMAKALQAVDMKGTVIVTVPASSKHSHTRRYKRFCDELQKRTNGINGFSHIAVDGKKNKLHRGKRDNTVNNQQITYEKDFFNNKDVLLVDDICTTGKTYKSFAEELEREGARIRMVLFLAKTKQYKH